MPIGTLMNSTQRQDSHSVITPPSTSPSDAPAVTTAVYMPSARVRSRPSAKLPTIIASTAGEAIAPPTPWAARAASSIPADVASPPASEATVNRLMPARKTRSRPRTSPARPPSSNSPPNARV